MRIRALAIDHDDTAVDSTARVHWPCFCEYMARVRPQMPPMGLEEYFLRNFDPGIASLLRDEYGLSPEELRDEQEYWHRYVQRHVPRAYPGVREIMERHKAAGGLLCVVSHSYGDNIRRDYRENSLPEPDLVFGWEQPLERRKPEPWPLEEIMRRCGLAPGELLMIDDLKPGYDMAAACGVDFAAVGWSNDIPEIERFMRENCRMYFKTVASLAAFLEG